MTLSAARSFLVLIDLQARLVPAIDGGAAMVAAAARLGEGAKLLGVPMVVTEQNPQGLGGSLEPIAGLDARFVAKDHFDCSRAAEFVAALPAGRNQAVLVGCEAHVCVLQTALGLIARDCEVAIVADAVGSRRPADKAIGLDRLRDRGAEIVTSEMVLFEWVERSARPEFKSILALVR